MPDPTLTDGARTPPEQYSLLAQEIVAVVGSLEPGEVVSYGDVAHDAGHPGAARAVGALLSATDIDLPWWRVVRSDGRIVTVNPDRQADRLRAEGVTVTKTDVGLRVTNALSGRFART